MVADPCNSWRIIQYQLYHDLYLQLYRLIERCWSDKPVPDTHRARNKGRMLVHSTFQDGLLIPNPPISFAPTIHFRQCKLHINRTIAGAARANQREEVGAGKFETATGSQCRTCGADVSAGGEARDIGGWHGRYALHLTIDCPGMVADQYFDSCCACAQ